jgi:two-component system sensor histidine kinase MprB
MVRRLRARLRAWPLQRRVAYLTTIAVALAVAVTSVAGYVTLRISLYRALDAEMVQTATSLAAVPVAQDIRTLGGLTERALRAGNVSVAAIRTDGEIFYVPDERDHLVLGSKELAIARLQCRSPTWATMPSSWADRCSPLTTSSACCGWS